MKSVEITETENIFQNSNQNSNIQFYEDPYRQIEVFLYILAIICTSSMAAMCSPIVASIIQAYDVSTWQIQYVNIAFSLMFIPANFIANYVLDHQSVRIGVTIGIIVTLIATYIRSQIGQGFEWVMLGQSLGGIAGPFIINAMSKISVQWFKTENRIIATAIMTSSYALGISLSLLFTTFQIESSDGRSAQRRAQEIKSMFTDAFYWTLGFTIPVLVFFKEKPQYPPSFVADTQRESFTEAIAKIKRNKEFLKLLLSFSIVLGNFIILSQILSLFVSPFGFSDKQIGQLGTMMNISCMVGKLSVGFVAGRCITLQNTLKQIYLTLVFLAIALQLSLTTHSIALVQLCTTILGFFINQQWTPALELACEVLYPIGEANANGSLALGGCISAVVVSLALQFFQSINSSYIIILLYLAAFVCISTMKCSLNRQEYENARINQNC